MSTRVAISLPSGSGFGWGVCGDSLREHLPSYFERQVQDGTPLVVEQPMIHAVQGTNMMPLSMTEWSSRRNVGLCFIEESELVRHFIPNAKRFFDHLCAGSSWCEEMLRDAGLKNVSTSIQGVDANFFCPATTSSAQRKFTIFSGGKAEWRKGTDVAMKLIGVMMQRHKDVHAVGNWHNPWEHSLNTMKWERGILGALTDAGVDFKRLSGPIDKSIKHTDTLQMYRQCDVGVFPNRVEGGTNMVMCEFMSCGKPVVSTADHGHRDVIRAESVFTSCVSRSLVSVAHLGAELIPIARYWEPSFEDMLARLELAYQHRDQLQAEGMRNRQHVKQFTWQACADSLVEACKL